MYGPIDISESNNMRHADCSAASHRHLTPSEIGYFNSAWSESNLQAWLDAKPHSMEQHKDCPAAMLAQGPGIRVWDKSPPHHPSVYIYVGGETYDQFRSALIGQ